MVPRRGKKAGDHQLQDLKAGKGRPVPVSYTHLDVYKRQVHERARIALISVADYVFLGTGLTQNLLPLSAGGEASASASTETGLRDLLYDCLLYTSH